MQSARLSDKIVLGDSNRLALPDTTREKRKKRKMYLPYKACTAQEDKIGNLQIWLGKNAPMPKEEEKIAYIQTSQDRETIFSACFDLEPEDVEEISKGYATTINLHIEYIADIFS